MAAMTTTATQQVRADIVEAIEAGEPLDDEQVRELFRFEASRLGLSFDEALERARNRTLPKNDLGFGLEVLARMMSE